jgi:hypothetical protein
MRPAILTALVLLQLLAVHPLSPSLHSTQQEVAPVGRFGQVDVDDIIACIIRDEARKANIPEFVPMGIAAAESGFDPNAEGDNGRSIGLFQLYLDGGQGSDYVNNPEALKNPRLNAQVAMPPIVNGYWWAVQQGYTGEDLIRQVAIHSGHPGRVDPHDYRVDSIYNWTVQLITNGAGAIVAWPPFNSAVCAGLPPPPPPIDTWSEGSQPTNRDEADAAISRHAERIGQLVDNF